MMYPSFKQQLATQQEGTILHSKTTRKSSPSQSMMYLYLKPSFGLVSNLLSAPPSIIDFNLDNLTLKTKFFLWFFKVFNLVSTHNSDLGPGMVVVSSSETRCCCCPSSGLRPFQNRSTFSVYSYGYLPHTILASSHDSTIIAHI